MLSIYLYKRYKFGNDYKVKRYELTFSEIERLETGWNTTYPYTLGNELSKKYYDLQAGDLSAILSTDTDRRKTYTVEMYYFFTKEDALTVNRTHKHVKVEYTNDNIHYDNQEENIFSHQTRFSFTFMRSENSFIFSNLPFTSDLKDVNINDVNYNEINIRELPDCYLFLEPRELNLQNTDKISALGYGVLNFRDNPTVLYIISFSKSAAVTRYIKDILLISTPLETPYDPSDIDVDNGDFDNDSDDIDTPTPPISNIFASGLVTAYTLDTTTLKSLSSYLWSSNFIDNIPKLFSEPFNAIIGLQLFPYQIVGTPSNITIGGIDTGIASAKLNSQYISISFGKLTCSNYFGSSLDYLPYTKISIYLPYIGVQSLNTNDVMGSELQLTYNIDLLSMSCVALLKCKRNKNGTNLESVLYHWNGNLGTQIPITGQSFSEIYKTLVNTITTIGLASSTGGASLAAGASLALNNALNSSVNVQRTNSIGSTYGVMSVQTPYLIIERPIQQVPKNYLQEYGSPCNLTEKVSDLSGYTELESIHLDSVNLTYNEKNELITLLNNGVVF